MPHNTVHTRMTPHPISISPEETVTAFVDKLEAEIFERMQAEERFRLTIEAAPNGIIMVNERGRIVLVNSMAERYFGYAREELVGQGLEKLVPVRFRAEHENLREAFFSQPEIRPMGVGRDLYGLHKDGSEFPVEIGLAPVKTQQGSFILATIVDITERKHAEAALAESEERLRLVWESTTDAMAISDAEGIMVDVNPAALRLFGYSREQIIGHSMNENVPEEARNAAIEQYKAVFASDVIPPTFESIVRRADGTESNAESSISFLHNSAGQRVAMLCTVRDVTEQKQAQMEVAHIHDLLMRAEQVGQSGSWVWEIATDHVTWSPGLYRLFGLTPAQFDATYAAYLERVHPGDREYVQQAIETAYRDHGTFEFENRIVWPDGQVRIEFTRGEVFLNAQGEPDRMIGIGMDITERKLAEKQVHLQLERLKGLRTIDNAISSSFDLRLTLEVLLNQLVPLLNVDAAAVILFQPLSKTLEYAACRGFRSPAIRNARLQFGDGYAGRAILDRRTIHMANPLESGSDLGHAQLFNQEEFADYYCVPLLTKGEIKGALEVFHRSPLAGDAEWLGFLETLAGQVAIAIENSQLFDGLQRSNIELSIAYDATIEGWSAALDLRDKETEGHSQRVTDMTLKLARMMDVGDSELMQVRRGALLHDIGKLGIPDHILLKPDKLTDEEWQVMRKHPTYGYEMLCKIPYLQPALDIPYAHHEKWDGSGYPRGLKREQIPLVARIFAVVDVWDALTSDRPYRAAWSKARALEFIREQSGKHFDPQVVVAFLKLITEA
jgi:PAS domain S-box-containing protein/putative nucleotidyltransferase with HDIG domain